MVVFPLPTKPVNTVTGTGRSAFAAEPGSVATAMVAAFLAPRLRLCESTWSFFFRFLLYVLVFALDHQIFFVVLRGPQSAVSSLGGPSRPPHLMTSSLGLTFGGLASETALPLLCSLYLLGAPIMQPVLDKGTHLMAKELRYQILSLACRCKEGRSTATIRGTRHSTPRKEGYR